MAVDQAGADGEHPDPPSPGRGRWWRRPTAIGFATFVLVLIGLVALTSQNHWWPFNHHDSALAIALDNPKPGQNVPYPTPVEGRITEGHLAGATVWAADQGGGGVYYSESAPCTMQSNNSFNCDPIFLGLPNEKNGQHRVCVLAVTNDNQFTTYAGRADPQHNNDGFKLDRAPVIAEDCHNVTRK